MFTSGITPPRPSTKQLSDASSGLSTAPNRVSIRTTTSPPPHVGEVAHPADPAWGSARPIWRSAVVIWALPGPRTTSLSAGSRRSERSGMPIGSANGWWANINCVRSICDLTKAGLRDHARDRSVLGSRNATAASPTCSRCRPRICTRFPTMSTTTTRSSPSRWRRRFRFCVSSRCRGGPTSPCSATAGWGYWLPKSSTSSNATVRVVGKHERQASAVREMGHQTPPPC